MHCDLDLQFRMEQNRIGPGSESWILITVPQTCKWETLRPETDCSTKCLFYNKKEPLGSGCPGLEGPSRIRHRGRSRFLPGIYISCPLGALSLRLDMSDSTPVVSAASLPSCYSECRLRSMHLTNCSQFSEQEGALRSIPVFASSDRQMVTCSASSGRN